MRWSTACLASLALTVMVLGCGSSALSGSAGDASATGGAGGSTGGAGGSTGGAGGSTGGAGGASGGGGGVTSGGPDAAALDSSPPADTAPPTDTTMTMADAGPGTDVASSAAHDYCTRGCATSAPLHCPKSASCVADCVSQYDAAVASKPKCRPSIDALLACGAARPLADWQCDTDGSEKLKPGVCDAEGGAAISCVLGP
jgi:hypothetical protein